MFVCSNSSTRRVGVHVSIHLELLIGDCSYLDLVDLNRAATVFGNIRSGCRLEHFYVT